MKPGIYRMHFRGLSFRECWRFGGEPFKFLIAVALKAIDFKGPQQWLPPHEGVGDCPESEVNAEILAKLQPPIAEARALGYQRGRFEIFLHNLDPHTKYGCAYRVMHDDGMRVLFIGCIKSDASGLVVTTVTHSGWMALTDGTDIEFVNHNKHFDATARSLKVQVAGKGLAVLDQAMANYTRTSRARPRHFATYDEMKRVGDDAGLAAYETRVARGLFRPVVK